MLFIYYNRKNEKIHIDSFYMTSAFLTSTIFNYGVSPFCAHAWWIWICQLDTDAVKEAFVWVYVCFHVFKIPHTIESLKSCEIYAAKFTSKLLVSKRIICWQIWRSTVGILSDIPVTKAKTTCNNWLKAITFYCH